MRSLLICPVVPQADWTGLSKRMALFADALRLLGGLDILVIALFDRDHARAAAAGQDNVRIVDATSHTDTQFRLLMQVSDRAERLHQFRAYGRGSRHAALTAALLAEIGRLVDDGRYDLIHIGRLYLADAIAAVPHQGIATLDLDEDDAAAWHLLAKRQPSVEAEWSLAEADAEDRLIEKRAPSFDRLFVAGPSDRRSLVARHPGLPVDVIENTAAFSQTMDRRDGIPTVLFVGSLGYAPNLEGVLWFLAEVWPEVRRRSDVVRCRIVGRAIPKSILGLDGKDGIEIVSDAEDLAPHYNAATLAVAPLFTGGGTRLKVIEAAAYGVAMVATTRAIAGLDFADGESLWVADDRTAFVEAVLTALGSSAARSQRAALARSRARASHDHAAVTKRLALTFSSLLQRRQQDET